MEREPLDNAEEHVSEFKQSPQYQAIIDEIEEEYNLSDEKSSSASKLESDDLDGVRTDIIYGAKKDSEKFMLSLQHFSPKEGTDETVGYILEGDKLVAEFGTSEDLMPEVLSQDGGSAILTPRYD